MKNILLKSALVLFLALTSCTKPDEPETPPQDPFNETIVCHVEQNLIKINDGGWVQNSTGDPANWIYYNSRGFKLNSDNLTVVTRDYKVITNGALVGIDPSLYQIEKPDATTIVFRFNNNLITSTSIVTVRLKTQN